MKSVKKVIIYFACFILFLIFMPQKVEAGVTGTEGGTPVKFVASSLTNLTSSNSSYSFSCYITAVAYTATLTPATNYTLPESITVKFLNGDSQTVWSNGNQYTYNPSTGSIFIAKEQIQPLINACSGSILITAIGAQSGVSPPPASTYKITVSQTENGAISPGTTSGIKSGSSKTFMITSVANYKIKDIVVDGKSQGAISTYTFSNIKANHTITAIFEKNVFAITVIQGENGVISPETVQNIQPSSEQTFAITPNKGYSITDVLVDNQSVGIVDTYTFADIQANHTITAVYEEKLYEIVVNQNNNGSISPKTVTGLKYGSKQTFTIEPLKGYKIKDVIVDGKSQGVINAYTFKNIKANHVITAIFAKQSHLLCWIIFLFLLLLLLLLIIWLIKRIIDKSRNEENSKKSKDIKTSKKKPQFLHKFFHNKKSK